MIRDAAPGGSRALEVSQSSRTSQTNPALLASWDSFTKLWPGCRAAEKGAVSARALTICSAVCLCVCVCVRVRVREAVVGRVGVARCNPYLVPVRTAAASPINQSKL